MWTRQQLKQNGMLNFKKNYWKSVLAALVLLFVGGGMGTTGSGSAYKKENWEDIMSGNYEIGGIDSITAATLIGGIVLIGLLIVLIIAVVLDVFVLNPLEVGAQRYFVANHYQDQTELTELAFGFKADYRNVVKTMFFRDLYVFLWSLLFVIPGIIKSYSYRMVPYLLTEHPDMEYNEALGLSQQMMNGNKWAAFVLDLSFIGWELLSAITFGIVGIFYVNPYKFATDTELYVALKETGQMENPAPAF